MVHNWFMDKVADNPQMKIRLSPALKMMVEQAAKTNNRTMNAEIISRLEGSFINSNFAFNGIIKNLAEIEGLNEKQKAEVEELIEQALKTVGLSR